MPQRTTNNLPITYAKYGQFVNPDDQGFLGRTLNAFGYIDAMQQAGHNAAESGMNPYTAGLAAILQYKNIRDTGKAYAMQEQRKRQELARFGNMGAPQDVIDQINAQQGIPPGQPLFNGQTYLDADTIGKIQYNLGNYRQLNMGKLPVYGALAPADQTGQSVRGALTQRGKATNFDYSQTQFRDQPFAAGQQASGVAVPVGNGQTMYMQNDTAGLGSMGRANQINDGPVLPTRPMLQGGVQQQINQPLAAGVNQPVIQDIDPNLTPTDYPNNVTKMFLGGAQDAQRSYQNQTNRQRVIDQQRYQQAQIKKLEEETRWLGPKAKAYIQNMTRPHGGAGRAPTKLDVARKMLQDGQITQQEYKTFILGGATKKSSGKKDPPGAKTLQVLGDLKSKYDEAGGVMGIGANPQMQQYYRDTYDSIATQHGLPRLPAKGGRMGKQDFLHAAGGGRNNGQ